jgi:hypothetical protein
VTATYPLELDTIPPGVPEFSIAGNETTTPYVVVSTASEDPTVGTMKIWGDVDESYDPGIQTSEEDSDWIAFSPLRTVKLRASGGVTTLHVRVRDDVFNPSAAASDNIHFIAGTADVELGDRQKTAITLRDFEQALIALEDRLSDGVVVSEPEVDVAVTDRRIVVLRLRDRSL